MTRSQRVFHRRAWLSLALILPLLCALSFALRAQHARALRSASGAREAAP